MKLIDYIKSDRRGKKANRIERQAQQDPFLSDAMEGYDSVYGNHFDKLTNLRQSVQYRAAHRRRRSSRWLIAALGVAAAIACAAGVSFFYLHTTDIHSYRTELARMDDLYNTDTAHVEPMVLYIPTEPLALYVPPKNASPSTDTALAKPHVPAAQAVITNNGERRVMMAYADTAQSTTGKQTRVAAMDSDRSIAASDTINQSVADARSIDDNVEEELGAVAFEWSENMIDETETIPEKPAARVDEESEVVSEAFMEYFEAHRTIFTDHTGQRIKGVVVVEFRVDKTGCPGRVKIISSPSQWINPDIIRALEQGPLWTPGTGKVRVNIPIE